MPSTSSLAKAPGSVVRGAGYAACHGGAFAVVVAMMMIGDACESLGRIDIYAKDVRPIKYQKYSGGEF